MTAPLAGRVRAARKTSTTVSYFTDIVPTAADADLLTASGSMPEYDSVELVEKLHVF